MRTGRARVGIDEELRRLRRWFVRRGLRIDDVARARPVDAELLGDRLAWLRDWVLAWEQVGDREDLEHRGFCFPPVDGADDPERSWARFEAWVGGAAPRALAPLPPERTTADG
jgi:hypothetical protein